MITLLTLLACGESDPVAALRSCADSDCQTATITAAYEADAAAVTEWLREADPVVQAALLDQLTHRFPGDARSLCAIPTDPQARTRCSRRNVRPHLFANPGGLKQPSAPAAVAASGPRSSDLPVPDSAAGQWESGAAMSLDCGTQPADLCAVEQSQASARSGGSAADIGARCRAGFPDLDRGYSECLFKAAEVVGEVRGSGGVADALALCSGSVFGPMCVAHLLTRASPPVPTADTFTAADIAAAAEVADAIQAAEPTHAELYVDRYWASWVYTSYSRAADVHGALLDALPEAALHHVPVAAAHRLMFQQPPRRFADEVRRLEAALARRPAITASPQHNPSVTRMRQQLWSRDWTGEEALRTTWMMGPARRAWSDDPAVELQIAVLESAAQLKQPPAADFFLDVLDEPDRDVLVRWTAARIGAGLDPQAAAQRTDDDPLVRARLSGSKSARKKSPPPGAPVPQPPQPSGSGG